MSQFNEDKAVARITELLALECNVHPVVARQIYNAAALHDVGKQKIPDNILNKHGKLTKEEFEIIKTHTTLGADLLTNFKGDLGEMARLTALYHHEKYDGTGYWGEYTCRLPYYVSMTAITDVFVALIYSRPYKPALSCEDALAYIESKAGSQFNPALVKVFIPLIQKDRQVAGIIRGGEM